MTQIKIFNETTYEEKHPSTLTIDSLTQKVNKFLADNEGKITIKDIKYSVQSPNPHQVFNLSVKEWIIMLIYETC